MVYVPKNTVVEFMEKVKIKDFTDHIIGRKRVEQTNWEIP